MENKKVGKSNLRNTTNQLMQFIAHDELIRFLIEKRRNYEGVPEKKQLDFLATTTLQLREILYARKIPKNWVSPLVRYIKTGELDSPLDNGLSIEANKQEITEKNRDVKFSDNQEAKAISDRRINISISAKLTISQIKKFLDDNKERLLNLMDTLQLPEARPLPWDETPLAIWIIALKDGGNLTFDQIADELQEEIDQKDSSTKVVDASYVKNLYYRYKERLYSLK